MEGSVGSGLALPCDGNDVQQTIACLCATVETATLVSPRARVDVQEIYETMRWTYPLEQSFDEAEQWSLRRAARARGHTHRREPGSEATDLERLLTSTTSERLTRTIRLQLQRVLDEPTDDEVDTQAPRQFQLPQSTQEVEAETRWSATGRPLPLRRNVLDEPYATLARPLAFVTRHADATELYRRMRPRVKTELRLRETRRIERLNAKRTKQEQEQGERTEDALEAKLDRLLRVEASEADLA